MTLFHLIFWFSAGLILYSYVLYPLLLVLWSNRSRMKGNSVSTEVPDKKLPRVTVIISIFNEEAIIEERIDNLLSIDYPEGKLQILIGSDGSFDGTNEKLRRYANSSVTVRFFDNRRGKASVLNDLIKESRGEVIVLSDANAMYARDTIRQLAKHFHDPVIGGVCGELVFTTDKTTPGGIGENFYWTYENSLKKLESDVKTTLGASGAVYAIRKDLFEPLPTKKVIMDDFLTALRVVQKGYRLKYEPSALAFERLSNSVLGEFKRRVRIGAANFHSISEILPLLHPRNGFVAFALWSHKIIRWFIPFLIIGLVISTVFLAGNSAFYQTMFVAEIVFTIFAVLGFLSEKFGFKIGVLGLPYYFLAINAALLVGFIKFLLGLQKPTWEVVR